MKISFIHPLDQPLNKRRLAHELAAALDSADFETLFIVVAAVSQAALLRLDDRFKKWKLAKKKITAIYGVDIAATSVEGLQYSLNTFDKVFIARIPGVRFHPKMYVFRGPKVGLTFCGSNNFTVPGTELNLEACIRIEYLFPADDSMFKEQMRGVDELLDEVKSKTLFKLDAKILADLVTEGLAVPEKKLAQVAESSAGAPVKGSNLPKSLLKKIPPSALPKKSLVTATSVGSATSLLAVAPAVAAVQVLVMQIKVHHNGEIFLSKIAVDQNPAFFGWPFAGTTVPKIKGNIAYPQRVPDPVVDITVIGAGGSAVLGLAKYGLNTVYYSTKSEIRVTCSALVPHVPDYSIMVMKLPAVGAGLDYEIEIHRPDSPHYAAWLAACNQTMPGGGKQARQFGWL